MKEILKCQGELVDINGHKIHIYRLGDINKPKIVLMVGSATVAPVYDFKVIYEKLSEYFRIIVIEKFGYGYSDICDYPSDIDTLVWTQKQALESVGETAPFILMPHSMSGLEALRWKQLYPDDISAIIGNDMATSLTYRIFTEETVEKKIKLMEFAAILNAKLIFYDCGHYIHHDKSDEMCKEIINFVDSLEE